MATEKKILGQAIKRSASGSPVESEQIIHHVLQAAIEWSNDHEFVSPNEIYMNAIGLLFCLTTKKLINISFTNLYHRSLKVTWMDLLHRERRNLKSNIISVEKSFMFNRLIAEYTKDPYNFAQQTGELYEEIKMRMTSRLPTSWTVENFYGQVRAWRNLQCQRRLFYMSHDEANQPHSILTLQRIASLLCSQFLNAYRINPTKENYDNLKHLLQHSYIIVTQPSIPECVAATKYEKLGDSSYSAKLYTRIIYLIDSDLIENNFTLSNIDVTLYPFDRTLDPVGEEQTQCEWHKRPIVDAEEMFKSFFYFELESIELKKVDTHTRNSRPFYRAKLCQLQFQFKIRINEFHIEEEFTLLSQPFGLCSHAQYYPEYVAKVLLHEVTQMPQSSGSVIQPNILANHVYRYHIRISGVEVKSHTSQYIIDILTMAYEGKKGFQNIDSYSVYEEILGKLISQMEMFIDHPFLSMMYHDGFFLGICDSRLDQQLHGTREQPHMLLRFNSLLTHQAIHQPCVRFIVHNGQLIRATFHTKAFVDEMCRMICEANSQQAKKMQFLVETSNRNFHEFSLYFDKELYRLNVAASPIKDAYQPLIPVLWNTMKINTDEQLRQTESMAVDLSTTAKNQNQSDLSNITVASGSSTTTNEKMIIHHVVEELSDLLMKSSNENASSTPAHLIKASTLLSSLTEGNIQQQKQLLSHLLHDYFQSKTNIEVGTQTSPNPSTSIVENT